MGFIERARRTSWHSNLQTDPKIILPEIQITQRGRKDWEKQKEWLEHCYPEEVRWNLPLNINFFSPGLWQDLVRFLNNEQTRHWAARDKNQLIGVLTWQPSRVTTDHLWLAVSPLDEERALKGLLPFARNWARTHRALEVNYPAGKAEEAFLECGFFAHVTLIWMEIRLNGT